MSCPFESSAVLKAKQSGADALFVYLNEEESARFLREAKKQGLNKPLIGETTLLGQKVIDLAGDAANGVKGHVGLTVDAPIPAIQEESSIAAGEGGVWIVSPQGKHLGTIVTPDRVANLAFGDADSRTLYMVGGRSLWRIRTNIPGIRPMTKEKR